MALTLEIALGYLRSAYERDRLAHAYLISGPAGSGKHRLVQGIAQLVNRSAPDDIFTHPSPEICLAAPESKSRRIVIEQIRELEHALQMRARTRSRKIAIISEAERMQAPAANAFLKTLEEPPNNSLLLLLSAIPEALPETILSRCLALPLAAPDEIYFSAEERELLDLLAQFSGNKTPGVFEAYRFAQGFQRLLGETRREIQEENDAALHREEARYKNTTDGAWLEKREDHFKALTESRYLARRAQLVETLFLWWSDVLRASVDVAMRALPSATKETTALAERLTTTEILHRFRALEELRDHLDRNVQENIAIEVAFLKIFRFETLVA